MTIEFTLVEGIARAAEWPVFSQARNSRFSLEDLAVLEIRARRDTAESGASVLSSMTPNVRRLADVLKREGFVFLFVQRQSRSQSDSSQLHVSKNDDISMSIALKSARIKVQRVSSSSLVPVLDETRRRAHALLCAIPRSSGLTVAIAEEVSRAAFGTGGNSREVAWADAVGWCMIQSGVCLRASGDFDDPEVVVEVFGRTSTARRIRQGLSSL